MKNKYSITDEALKMINMAFIALVVIISILYVYKILTGKVNSVTNVPSLNVSKVQNNFNELNKRNDVSTNGKPDLSKVTFGNQEPF